MGSNDVRSLPPLYDGMIIAIQGNIQHNANGFLISFCAGPNYGQCDNAFCVNPRYNQNNVVVRNSFINGNWGPEERGGIPFPISRGQPLECLVLVTNDLFKVAFNGQHYCEYRHRIPKERVTHLIIGGELQLYNMTTYGSNAPPSFPMSYPSPYQIVGSVPAQYPASYPTSVYPSAYPEMPNKKHIPGGMYPGRMIHITATPGPNGFAVNLRCQEHGGDIAFHFNPRIKQGVVVRNSHLGGHWGPEERGQPYFPFHAGVQFTMIILCEASQFKVAVNNQHFTEYRMRVPNLQSIQWVEIGESTNPNIVIQ